MLDVHSYDLITWMFLHCLQAPGLLCERRFWLWSRGGLDQSFQDNQSPSICLNPSLESPDLLRFYSLLSMYSKVMSWVQYLIGIQSVGDVQHSMTNPMCWLNLVSLHMLTFFKLLDKSYCISTAIFSHLKSLNKISPFKNKAQILKLLFKYLQFICDCKIC